MGVKSKSKAAQKAKQVASSPPPAPPADASNDAESSTSAIHVLDTAQGEIALFRALTRHRPVGPDKDEKMVSLLSVVNRALTNVERDEGQPEPTVTTDELWDKLGRMFNLESLDMLNTPSSPSTAPDDHAHPDSPSFHSRKRTKGLSEIAEGSDMVGVGEGSDSSLSEDDGEGKAAGEEQVKEEEEKHEEEGVEEVEEQEEEQGKKAVPKKRKRAKR